MKEKVMVEFTKTNDPIWPCPWSVSGAKNAGKYAFDSLLKVV